MSSRINDVTVESGAILSWLQQGVEEIAALLADLVTISTENPPGKHYRACVDLLETHMRKADLDCERLGPGVPRCDIEDCPESLLATHGRGEQALYFHGHYVVVPAQTSVAIYASPERTTRVLT
jgi:succinyl-diaminopimelate desuccinylase